MKLSQKKYSFILSLILLNTFIAKAQFHEFGIQGGIANYKGEIAPTINLTSPLTQLGVFYKYNPSEVVSLRVSGSFAQISAKDADSEDVFALTRNHSFKTTILEIAGQVEYNFFNFRSGSKKNAKIWSPYFFAGFGAFKFDPLQNLQPTYKTWSVALPLGIGVKSSLGERWNIGLECGARFTFTDFLDDLGVEVNANQPPKNPQFFSGNPNNKDMYFLTSLSLSYVIPNKGKACPIKLPQ